MDEGLDDEIGIGVAVEGVGKVDGFKRWKDGRMDGFCFFFRGCGGDGEGGVLGNVYVFGLSSWGCVGARGNIDGNRFRGKGG